MQAQATQLPPGTVLGGDFQVQAPLSSGGMGAVYVALQISTGKQRALKVMHPSFVTDASMRDRFVREARVGAMVPSDHVVEVVGAGVDPQLGVPWLAMELLSGEDLARHLARRGPLSVAELTEIFKPVCHALGAAHARGIVHRDVKPENVFLATTQSTTHPVVVKVLDFGIARVAADAQATSTTAMGTPMWMAPEQTELKSHVSPASDVWAIGLLAFWLLTGRPYWRAGNQGGASVPQLMREILFEPLDAPSQRAAEYGAAGTLPPGFDGWFARCVARDPAARFQSASDAANGLFQEVLGLRSGVSIAPPPDPSGATWPSVPPPMASAPTLQSQGTAATVVATATAGAAPKRGGVGLILLALGVVVAFAAVAVAGGAYFYFAQDSEEAEGPSAAVTPPSSTPAATESAPEVLSPSSASAASASSASSASAPSVSTSVVRGASGKKKEPASPAPAASSAPSAATATKKDDKPPYDAAAAVAAVQGKANWARNACKNHEGPAAISGQAVFKPSGTVYWVKMPAKDSMNSRAGCVRALVLGAIIKPYAGNEEHSVPFAVGF